MEGMGCVYDWNIALFHLQILSEEITHSGIVLCSQTVILFQLWSKVVVWLCVAIGEFRNHKTDS